MEVRRGETNNIKQHVVLLARAQLQVKGTQRSLVEEAGLNWALVMDRVKID